MSSDNLVSGLAWISRRGAGARPPRPASQGTRPHATNHQWPNPALELRGVEFTFPEGFQLWLDELVVSSGELVGVLGPNGSGKTTLLRLAAGTLAPRRGQVLLEGRTVSQLSRREVARGVAVVPQESRVPFAYTVREIVSLGRTPYANLFSGLTAADREAVERAIQLAGLTPLAERYYSQISGGERQRAILAMALAQEPRLLLLDEPTNHLDVAYQLDVLERLRDLNRAVGLTVVASTHDLNLASLFFDRLVLMAEGRIVADGPPAAVLTSPLISTVYGSPVRVIDHPTEPVPLVALTRNGRGTPPAAP